MINKLMLWFSSPNMEQSDLDTNNFGKKAKVIFYGCNEQHYQFFMVKVLGKRERVWERDREKREISLISEVIQVKSLAYKNS